MIDAPSKAAIDRAAEPRPRTMADQIRVELDGAIVERNRRRKLTGRRSPKLEAKIDWMQSQLAAAERGAAAA